MSQIWMPWEHDPVREDKESFPEANILKMSRRWESEEEGKIVEAVRIAGAVAAQWEEPLHGGETEAGPHCCCSDSKHIQGPHEH